MQINWDNFKTYNLDSAGVRLKFEDLCRQLFVNENTSGNKQFRYLHANPNNAGLETEPIYDETNNRNIGFQAKFFDPNVDYSQIEHSAQMTVKHYAGRVDLVYLFSNKPLKSSSLAKTEKILKSANIELQLITDKAILDLVILKYPYLGVYYFGSHTINKDWIRSHSNRMFDELGDRYNRLFNVETQFSIELSLFVHDQNAVHFINKKKSSLLKTIEQKYWNDAKYRPYLRALKNAADKLSDVDIETLYESIAWKEELEKATNSFIENYENRVNRLTEERKTQRDLAFGGTDNREEHDRALRKYQELGNQINELDEMIGLLRIVEITEREKQLLYGDILAILGRAGIGKSQLLATETKILIDGGREALLLLSGVYFGSGPIHDQIMKNLRLDYNLDELLDILESIGERCNRIVPVFIDALNEIWNKKLWKLGLPSVIEKIKSCPMVRLVFTYRPEYENLILADSVKEMKEKGDILTMYHRGFEDNSVQAAKEFMNRYGIPFTPLESFGYEMTNPLFLTLYCKTYNGEEVSLPELYERVLKGANAGIFKVMGEELTRRGFTEEENIVRAFVNEIASIMISRDVRTITYQDLLNLSFWSYYQLAPAVFIRYLVNEQILHETVYNENELHYYLAYDQMNDYYCAKAIVQKYCSKDELRKYLSETVLGIKDGELSNSWNVDLFVNACALYAEKYGEECINIIDALTDNDDKWTIFSSYLSSFQWRDKRYMPANKMYDLLKSYPCEPEDLWKMLIGNSVKVSHPLNAEFLHRLLISYPLNRRDYLWTIYINRLTCDEADRIVQLVQMYDRGEGLNISDEKQVELLLILFGWLLTSSNRWLRDYTSKSMVEVLKRHFALCKPLLEKFRKVNDPYVIQRLYGVVFGASCKRVDKDLKTFQDLAEYVYNTIFNQEQVYPDILLRDYARMIIERFLFENPEYKGCIDYDMIIPPYRSEPIPEIEDQHYLEGSYDGGMFWLMHSMRFEGMGMYGDFGRYVYQSALHDFEVDDKEIFNYSVYYILNELGYKDEFFDDHDRQCGSYDRHKIAKTERIGKKYQWITMYNVLARVSDHCKMIDRWSYPEKKDVQYEGTWEPYVRDFDPTLNNSFMSCPNAPKFIAINEFVTSAKKENDDAEISDEDKIGAWLEKEGVLFRNLKDTLILKDDDGTEWVSLTKYIDTGRNNLADDKLLVWCWMYAYFMKPEQAEALKKIMDRGGRIAVGSVNSHHQTYSVFNREYPWAPSCKTFNDEAWEDISLPTGEKKKVTETVRMPDLSDLSDYEKFLKTLGYISSSDEPEDIVSLDDSTEPDSSEDCSLEIPYKDVTVEREVEEVIGKILHASSDLLWEEEYDATKETAISWSVPCSEIINTLGLEQHEYDGFYYDPDGKLAAFDTDLVQNTGGVVIRKDLLDEFISKTGFELVWIVQAAKEIHGSDLSISKWSDWEALYEYDSGTIIGDMHYVGI